MRIGRSLNQDDARFLQIATGFARRLETRCGVTKGSSVLDIGCGQARLLYGLIRRLGEVARYVGVDVNAASINWLQETLQPRVPFASFQHIPFINERYNPAGSRDVSLDIVGPFDCVVLLSVFSHMWLADIEKYLQFVSGALDQQGRVFITLFVEDDVPPEIENPENYLNPWSGPMHCVRLNRSAFEDLVAKAGFAIADFQYRDMGGGMQSSYVLAHSGR